jgi:hypothetical protein
MQITPNEIEKRCLSCGLSDKEGRNVICRHQDHPGIVGGIGSEGALTCRNYIKKEEDGKTTTAVKIMHEWKTRCERATACPGTGYVVVDSVLTTEAEAALADLQAKLAVEWNTGYNVAGDVAKDVIFKLEATIKDLQAKLAAAEKARHPDLWWRPETYQDLVKKQGDTIREQKARIASLEVLNETGWKEVARLKDELAAAQKALRTYCHEDNCTIEKRCSALEAAWQKLEDNIKEEIYYITEHHPIGLEVKLKTLEQVLVEINRFNPSGDGKGAGVSTAEGADGVPTVTENRPTAPETPEGHKDMWWYGIHIPTLVKIKEIINSDEELGRNIAAAEGLSLVNVIIDKHINMPSGDGTHIDVDAGIADEIGKDIHLVPETPEGFNNVIGMPDSAKILNMIAWCEEHGRETVNKVIFGSFDSYSSGFTLFFKCGRKNWFKFPFLLDPVFTIPSGGEHAGAGYGAQGEPTSPNHQTSFLGLETPASKSPEGEKYIIERKPILFNLSDTETPEGFNREDAYTDECPKCGEKLMHGDVKHQCKGMTRESIEEIKRYADKSEGEFTCDECAKHMDCIAVQLDFGFGSTRDDERFIFCSDDCFTKWVHEQFDSPAMTGAPTEVHCPNCQTECHPMSTPDWDKINKVWVTEYRCKNCRQIFGMHTKPTAKL